MYPAPAVVVSAYDEEGNADLVHWHLLQCVLIILLQL